MADFRAFCRNDENRLRDFWEESKQEMNPLGVRLDFVAESISIDPTLEMCGFEKQS